jgi:hypothetical protein
MDTILALVALFALALLLGGMSFFAAVMAPLIFTRLPAGAAGPFIRQVFPVYYVWVLGCSAAAAVALLPIGPAASALMAASAALAFWLRQTLMPTINRLSDAAQAGDAAAAPRFARMHRLSVAANVLQMVVAAAVLAMFVLR